jgi:hypothetical protein
MRPRPASRRPAVGRNNSIFTDQGCPIRNKNALTSLGPDVSTVTCRGGSRLATRKGPVAEPSHEGSASWLLCELRLQTIGVLQLALQTELVYWEWESRLEISVAWISPAFSAVPLQIT